MAFLRSPYIKFSAIGIDNLPLSGGKVYTYIAGTNTPTNTWSDFGITLNSNPVDLNSMGQANIFLTENFAYKFVIKDSLDNLVDTQDNIVALMSTGGGGTATTLQNIGTGEGVYAQLVGSTAQLKSLKAGNNVALTSTADEITISANSTTAGLLDRVYFLGDEVIVNSVTYYGLSRSGKGTLSAEQQVVCNDDVTDFFAQDFISDEYTTAGVVKAGSYNAIFSAKVSISGAEQQYKAEIYLCDSLGNPIASGISGAPIGDLGVQVIGILDSGIIDMQADTITQIHLNANVGGDVTYAIGQRIRLHVSAKKVGTAGANATLSLFSGLLYDSYVDVPVSITTDMVTDTRNGQILTTSLNGLIAKDGTTTTTAVIPFAQGLSSALGMSITGVQAGGSAIKIPDGSWIRPQTEQGGFYLTNGSNPSALNSVLHLTNSGSLFSCGDGVDQFGQISIGSGGTSIYHNENGIGNSSISLSTNYVTLYSGDNSNLVVTSNSATMYGGDSNLTLNDDYASLYQAGSGFYIDSTGIKPQGISPGTVSANSFVGLNSAGYLVKSGIAYGDITGTPSLNFQPLDADLTAIAGLSADGLLRKTSGVWGMDAVVYVTQTALDLKANIASPTFTGTVSGITSAMVGLGNVNNTSDSDKPVSTATQTALNLKANIASPTFTGNPLAPTPALGDNDTSIATTAFVRSAINSVTAVASTATLTVNSLTTTQANITAQAVTLTIASPTGGVDGRKLIIRIKDDNTARGITWNAIFRAVGVTLPLTTVAGKILYVGAIYNSTETKWDVVSVAQQA